AAARAGEGVGDYKSMLQEYFQAHGLGQPKYEVTAEAGPDHRKSFVIAVKLVEAEGREETLASASGTRKKQAEQEAARMALEHLRATRAVNGSAVAGISQ
ncbi:MAG: putative dsRNA-binding protein, partial [Acidobacteriaceae bacterium]